MVRSRAPRRTQHLRRTGKVKLFGRATAPACRPGGPLRQSSGSRGIVVEHAPTPGGRESHKRGAQNRAGVVGGRLNRNCGRRVRSVAGWLPRGLSPAAAAIPAGRCRKGREERNRGGGLDRIEGLDAK